MGEQIGKTLAAAELLVSGERMRQQCDELCWPLLAMLDSRGYRYRILELNEDGVQLLVWKLSPEAGPDGSPIRRAA